MITDMMATIAETKPVRARALTVATSLRLPVVAAAGARTGRCLQLERLAVAGTDTRDTWRRR